MGRCVDFKVGCGCLNNIVSAGDILNLDLIRTLVRPVLAGIRNICDLILALRDHVVLFVPDRDRGPLHITIVFCAGRCQLNLNIIRCYCPLLNGNLNALSLAVRVVAITLGLVPDRVLASLLGFGDGGGKIGAVQRVDHGAARHSARRNQLLGLAGVIDQRVHSFRNGIHRGRRRQNSPGSSLGVGDVILFRIGTADGHIAAVQCDRLRANAGAVISALQAVDADRVTAD